MTPLLATPLAVASLASGLATKVPLVLISELALVVGALLGTTLFWPTNLRAERKTPPGLGAVLSLR